MLSHAFSVAIECVSFLLFLRLGRHICDQRLFAATSPPSSSSSSSPPWSSLSDCGPLTAPGAALAAKSDHLSYRELIPRYCFTLIFALGCCILQLVLFEMWGVLVLRSLFWRLYLGLLIALLLVFLPFYQSYMFVADFTGIQSKRTLLLMTSVVYLAYYFLFSKVIDPTGVSHSVPLSGTGIGIDSSSSGGGGAGGMTLIDAGLSRLLHIGVAVHAMLSAFGSVNLPFSILSASLSVADASKVKHAIATIEQRIDKLQMMIESANRQAHMAARTASKGPLSMPSSLLSFLPFGGGGERDGSSAASSAHTQRINSLKSMQSSLRYDLQDQRRQLARIQSHKNVFIRIGKTIVGYGCALFGLVKIISTTYTIVFVERSIKDQEMDLRELLGLGQFYSQMASMGVVTVIIVMSVRSLLLNVHKLLQWFRVSSESVILFFAQLMGVYFISSLLLLFSKIPTEYRQELQNTVNMEHFVVFFKHWFDVLFLLCSVVSLVGLVLLERWNHAQRLDYYH